MTNINELIIARKLSSTQILMLHMLRLMFHAANEKKKTQYLVASNKDLSKLFDLREETISRNMRVLEEEGYLKLEYDNPGEGLVRRIYFK